MNPKCPACGAGSWKNGFSRSGRRVYKCKSCGRKFNERAGTPFWHLKKEERDVLTASLLYVKYPLSTYHVADLLEFFGVDVAGTVVLGTDIGWKWVREQLGALRRVRDQVLKN